MPVLYLDSYVIDPEIGEGISVYKSTQCMSTAGLTQLRSDRLLCCESRVRFRYGQKDLYHLHLLVPGQTVCVCEFKCL